MMLSDVFIVAAIGLSLGSASCAFYPLGMSTSSKKAAAYFIVGRFISLFVLGIILNLIGLNSGISPEVMFFIFGLTSIILGLDIMFKKPKHHSGLCFSMGFFRGMTPCIKLLPIMPIIMVSGFTNALFLMFIFGLTSSIYPILGILSAPYLSRLFKQKRHIRQVGGLILILMGLYYLLKPLFYL